MSFFHNLGKILTAIGFIIMLIPFISYFTGRFLFVFGATQTDSFSVIITNLILGGLVAIIGMLIILWKKPGK